MNSIFQVMFVLCGVLCFSQVIHAAPGLKVTMLQEGGVPVELTIAPGESPNTKFSKGLSGVSIAPVDMDEWVVVATKVHSQKSGWTDWLDSTGKVHKKPLSHGIINALSLYLADAGGGWDMSYRIHQDGRWSDWCYSGEPVGDPNEGGAILALQIKLHNLAQETDTMIRGQYITKGGNEEDKAPVSLFQDEKLALDKANKNPSSENLIALARIRYLHAMDFLRVAEDKNDLDAMELALQYANGAVEVDPYEPAYWQLIGVIHARFIEDDSQQIAALNAFSRAIELSKDNPGLLLLAADVEQRLGLVGEAAQHLYHAMKIDPDQIDQTRLGLFVSACTQGEMQQLCRQWLTELRPESAWMPAMQISDALLLINTDPLQAKRLLKLVADRGTEQQVAYAEMLLNEVEWREANQ